MEAGDIDRLLTKVLAGEASAEEKLAIDQWRNESPDNQVYYEECKLIFDRIDSLKDPVHVNTETAWMKLDQKISASDTRIIPLFKKTRFIAAAASLFLLVTLGFVLNWFFSTQESNALQLATTQARQTHRLPDGSSIVLEKNTELSYVETKTKERRVKLKGQAHFEIVHNEEKAFIIEVDNVLIKDIGTAFYVKALPESNIVEVSVEEGEVQFFTESNSGLRLVANESATYDKITKQFIRLSPGAAENTFKQLSRQLNFDNNTLAEVIDQVNFVYGSKIRLADEKLSTCRLSVNFKNEELDVLLAVIAETLDLKIHKQDSSIILEGKPCGE